MRSVSAAAVREAIDDRYSAPASGIVAAPVEIARPPASNRPSADILHPVLWGRPRWGETPTMAPLHMEARPFVLISWREILRSAGRWLRIHRGGGVGRLSDVGIEA